MYGKFPKNSMLMIRIFLLLLFTSPTLAQNNFSVNDFEYPQNSEHVNKGLRLKGIGDFFFHNKSYAKAVSYYQEALEYMPHEADISFRLGEIYQHEKLWRLSILYYGDTITALSRKENFEKSQLNRYRAQIRIAQIAHEKKDPDLFKLLENIRKEESLLKSSYPEAWEEFQTTLGVTYPSEPTRAP